MTKKPKIPKTPETILEAMRSVILYDRNGNRVDMNFEHKEKEKTEEEIWEEEVRINESANVEIIDLGEVGDQQE